MPLSGTNPNASNTRPIPTWFCDKISISMTRILSELLQAREPHFRIALKQLEHAAGAPSADIRLSSELNLHVKDKLRELNLDPRDTTAEELYHALSGRVRRDNQTLLKLLQADRPGNLMPRIERLFVGLEMPRQVFALKNACAKKLLKNNPPKKVLKQLGYRSLDSLLKHEPPCALMAAARVAEGATWHKAMQVAYKKLTPSDFETRDAVILAPSHQRWEAFARPHVAENRHNVLTVPELGAVVLLPLEAAQVEGAPLAVTLLTLEALHEIRALSAYLKLQQVRPDFGAAMAKAVHQEPMTNTRLLKMPLPWKMVHTFFGRYPSAYRAELFEPHVQPDDLKHESICATLARLHPTFEFWSGTSHLGLQHGRGGVSLHPLDAVVNFVNQVPFAHRQTRHMRAQLWQELLLRYMAQDNLAGKLRQQLADELVPQAALV